MSDACLALAAGGGTQGALLRKFDTNLEEGRREGGREGGEWLLLSLREEELREGGREGGQGSTSRESNGFLKVDPSSFRFAANMSSLVANSTTPSPSLFTSA